MKKITFFFLLPFLVFSCKKNEPTIWEVDIYGPAIKTTLTVNNILHDSVSSLNPDNSVNIDYVYPFSPLKEQFFIEIPDTTIKQIFPIPFSSATSLPPGFQFVSNTSENVMDLGFRLLNKGDDDETVTGRIPFTGKVDEIKWGFWELFETLLTNAVARPLTGSIEDNLELNGK